MLLTRQGLPSGLAMHCVPHTISGLHFTLPDQMVTPYEPQKSGSGCDAMTSPKGPKNKWKLTGCARDSGG